MPKDIRSFFKPAGTATTTKARSPSPPNQPKSSPKKASPKKPTPKKPTPKKPTPKNDHKPSSKRKSRSEAEQKKVQEPRKSEKIVIDDDSDDDIIRETPPRKETKQTKSSKGKVGVKKSQDWKDTDDFECLKTRKKQKETCPSSDEEVKPKARKQKRREESPIDEEKKIKKKKKAMVIDSDSEEEVVKEKKPRKPRKKKEEVVKEKKPRKPRKKKEEVPLIGVSDDDTPAMNPLKDAFSHAKVVSEVAVEKTPEKKKQVSVSDFFGSGHVERKERTASLKRKSDVIELHDDDDFDQTLAQIDLENLEQPAKRPKTQVTKESDVKSTPSKDSPLRDNNSNVPVKSYNSESTDTKKQSESAGNIIPPATNLSPPMLSPDKAHVKPDPHTPKPSKSEQKSTGSSPAKAPQTPSSAKPASTPSSDAKRSGYYAYKHRAGPSALGSKEIPEGAPNCLEGLTFVITGIQESIDRDSLKSLLERYGAKVTTSVSKKTSFLITGREAGDSKINKANQLGTKVIEEDDVFEMIRTKPGKESKYEIEAKAAVEKERKAEKNVPPKAKSSLLVSPKAEIPSLPNTPRSMIDSDSQTSQATASPQAGEFKPGEALLWVDKYKPKTLRNIIGQQGDKSNAKKLMNWLKCWHNNIRSGKKPNFANRWNDDGSGYRGALLSGPPGVGKTTTAHLVCDEAGFTFVEMNASDSRSKKTLESEVSEMLQNRSLDRMFGDPEVTSSTPTHCLVMDEVDGMAGNEDRGGMAELIQLIKKSSIPVICICNDRQSPKVRSLANHCFDLRFQKPRVEQIKSAMMSIAFKEGLKVPPPALNEIILASNQDVRQVIHNLAMFSASGKALTYDQSKKDANDAQKDMKIGPFDVVRRVFSSSEESGTINSKADLFFNDYSIEPLFVQENYVHVQPAAAKGDTNKHLALLAQCADSIADGDIISRAIRSSQSWSLLPLQAIASSVIPGELMRGYLGQQIAFPAWLGKNSTTNKNRRLLEEINSHMHLKVSCDKDGLNMDYRTYLKNALYKPLLKDDGSGVEETLDLLNNYDLMKDDFEALLELSQWNGDKKGGMSQVNSKIKAALTRKCNQSHRKLPYVTGTATKAKKSQAENYDEEGNLIEEDGAENSDDDDIGKIASIKAVKPKAEKKPTKSDKGKGKGKKSK